MCAPGFRCFSQSEEAWRAQLIRRRRCSRPMGRTRWRLEECCLVWKDAIRGGRIRAGASVVMSQVGEHVDGLSLCGLRDSLRIYFSRRFVATSALQSKVTATTACLAGSRPGERTLSASMARRHSYPSAEGAVRDGEVRLLVEMTRDAENRRGASRWSGLKLRQCQCSFETRSAPKINDPAARSD